MTPLNRARTAVTFFIIVVLAETVGAAPPAPTQQGPFPDLDGDYARVCFGSSRHFKLDEFPQTVDYLGYFKKHMDLYFAKSRISIMDGNRLRKFLEIRGSVDDKPVRSICIDLKPGRFELIAENHGFKSAYPSENEKSFWRGVSQRGNWFVLRGLPERRVFEFKSGQHYQIVVGEVRHANNTPLVVFRDVSAGFELLQKCIELRDSKFDDEQVRNYYQIAALTVSQAMACDTVVYGEIPQFRFPDYRGIPKTEKKFTRKLKKIRARLAKRGALSASSE